MPPMAAATSRLPSAEQATERQVLLGTLLEIQVTPASLEVKIFPFEPTALAVISFVPSAEPAIEIKSPPTLLVDQVEPELVERKTVAPPQTAASLLPSADEAMDFQGRLGV